MSLCRWRTRACEGEGGRRNIITRTMKVYIVSVVTNILFAVYWWKKKKKRRPLRIIGTAISIAATLVYMVDERQKQLAEASN